MVVSIKITSWPRHMEHERTCDCIVYRGPSIAPSGPNLCIRSSFRFFSSLCYRPCLIIGFEERIL
jgi:hypothetical protein